MVKKILCSVISFVLCAVIAFVACYFSIPDFNAWVKGVISSGKDAGGDTSDGNNTENGNYVDSADLDFKDGESNGIQLLSAKLPFEAFAFYNLDSSKTSYQLTATVMPETAENKAVDWSAKWADSSLTENVYDYLSITPTYDGSTVANVVCEKAFTGEIVIVVTTRQGGCTAEKICVFVGKPTSVSLSSSNASINNGAVALSVGVTYDFDISYNNFYNSVGADYSGASLGGMTASGTLTLGGYGDGGWNNLHQVEFASLADNFISYSLNGSVLSVKIIKNPTSYYESKTGAGSRAYYSNKFYSYDSECYFMFYINNAKLGMDLQYKLTVTIDTASVSGVNISGGEILEF